MPEQYWQLTSLETLILLQGYYMRDMQISTLTAAFLNVHRDPKRSQAIKAEDVSVFKAAKEAGNKTEQTPEQQRKILEAMTLMLGGEVCENV